MEGVNPPIFEVYFCRGIRDVAGIGGKRGLDKFSAEFGFRGPNRRGLVDAREIIGYESAFDRDHGSGRDAFGFVVMSDVEQIGGADSEAKAEG